MNFYTGSFLEEGFDKHMKEVWELDGFDIVMGNPPYHSPSKSDNSANSLWVKFIYKSDTILNKKGFMLIIAGNSWLGNDINYTEKGRMTIAKVRSKIFKKNQLLFVKYGGKLNKFFPKIDIDFCYFLMEKSNHYKKTHIVNDFGEYHNHHNDLPIIPLYDVDISFKILKNTILSNKKRINFLNKDKEFISDKRKWKGNFSLEKTKEHIYPSCNTSAQYNKNSYIWSKIKDKNQDIKKVIFSDSGYLSPFYDDGKYGLNSHSFGIQVKNEKESNNVIFYMNSNIVKFLSGCFPASGFENATVKIMEKMPQIDFSKSWTDEELYEYFG